MRIKIRCGNVYHILKNLKKLKVYLTGINIQLHLKKSIMTISMKSLIVVKKVFGSLIKISLLMLLALTTCTCSGVKLMLGQQIIGNQTDYSLYSGKLARPIKDVTVCATSKTDGLVFHSWHQVKLSTKLQYQAMQDSVYCQSQVLTRKKCLQIR